MTSKSPHPSEVVELRERIQARDCLGITAAQDYCADMLDTSRRAWQQWERGERKMHAAFWELANLKANAVREEANRRRSGE